MQREQFIKLLKSPFQGNENSVEQVKEITKEFPYFQTAQLLYAKLLKESHHIHFDSQLKIAAVYAADRKQLHHLIEQTFSEKILEPVIEAENLSAPVLETADETKEETQLAEIKAEETPAEKILTPKFSPEEIIRQRLEEIEQEKNQDKKIIIENKEEPVIHFSEIMVESDYKLEDYLPPAISEEELKPEPGENIKQEPPEVKEEIISARPDKEIPEKVKVELSEHIQEKHSFLKWLSFSPLIAEKKENKPVEEKDTVSGKIAPVENIVEEKKEEPKIPAGQIIEKFIKEEPRISPAKAAFFSSVNMARKSVEEHDDMVSPTLAQIYLMQGNTSKAIETYQKLILLYPEKSTYFAVLIEKIKKNN